MVPGGGMQAVDSHSSPSRTEAGTRAMQTAELAWEEQSFRRERTEVTAITWLTLVFVPLWSVFDHWLEPLRADAFLGARLADLGISVLVLALLRRATTPRRVRLLGAGKMVFTGLVIAWMLPQVVDSFWPYVIGFSLVFWMTGILFSSPVGVVSSVFALSLGGFLAAPWLVPSVRAPEEWIGASFYLVTVSFASGAVTFVRHRSERRSFLAARELEERNRELARTISQLEDAQARLVESEKLAVYGRLLAGISHELSNPVNVVANTVPFLSEAMMDLLAVCTGEGPKPAVGDLQTPGPASTGPGMGQAIDLDLVRDDIEDALRCLSIAAERIVSVYSQFRTFGRDSELRLSQGDLRDGLELTLRMMRRQIPSGVEIFLDVVEVPPFLAHFDQLNQVWLNLLRNALDSMGSSGSLHIEARSDAGEVVVTFADSGGGVPEALHSKIFDPFFTTKEVGKGTGLGLPACRQILRRHGGDLRLEPTPRGARFSARLPLRPVPDEVA